MVSPDSEWVWSTGAVPSPSCSSPAVVNNAQMCEGDPTSIVFQASGDAECLASKMECAFNMHDLDQLDFDIHMFDCKGTWAAPLWMSPNHWQGNGESGEIDMLENCPTDKVRSNFAGGGREVSWTSDGNSVGDGNDFRAHTTLRKHDDGNGVMSIYVKSCDRSSLKSDGTCPIDGAAYLHDIYGKYGCSNGDCQYHMISDLWNGVGGDNGWRGCTKSSTAWGSQCKFSVTNIRTKGVTFTGKCAAMMGSNRPSPTPAPSPAPSPSGGSCSVGDIVKCSSGELCAGNSCCHDGSTCSSAHNSYALCPQPKQYDCTTADAPKPQPSHESCSVGDIVMCSSGEPCSGSQCCHDGKICPSADNSIPLLCSLPKEYDCTAARFVV